MDFLHDFKLCLYNFTHNTLRCSTQRPPSCCTLPSLIPSVTLVQNSLPFTLVKAMPHEWLLSFTASLRQSQVSLVHSWSHHCLFSQLNLEPYCQRIIFQPTMLKALSLFPEIFLWNEFVLLYFHIFHEWITTTLTTPTLSPLLTRTKLPQEGLIPWNFPSLPKHSGTTYLQAWTWGRHVIPTVKLSFYFYCVLFLFSLVFYVGLV